MNILFEINWLAIAIGTIAYSEFYGIWHRQFRFEKKNLNSRPNEIMIFDNLSKTINKQILYQSITLLVQLFSCSSYGGLKRQNF